MNEEYIDAHSKFLDELHKPKEYYELTLEELYKLCIDFRLYSVYWFEEDAKEYIDQWLTENIKENQ